MKKSKRKLTLKFGAAAMAIVMAAAFAVTEAAPAYGAGNGAQARAISTADTIQTGSNTITLKGCVEGKMYVLAVVKGSYTDHPVSEGTLLYIDQKTAEGSELEFTFNVSTPDRAVVLVSSNDGAGDYPVIIGELNIPISEATVTIGSRTYNGKAQTAPVSSVKYRGGALKSGTDYTVTGKGTNVGTYTFKVSGKGRFKGEVSRKFSIKPVGTSLKSLKGGKKSITVKWGKPASKYKKQMTGYQIQYSLKSDFSSAKTVKVSGYSKTSKTIKSLNAKKKYYVRIRTYKGSLYSSWSKAKTVKTK